MRTGPKRSTAWLVPLVLALFGIGAVVWIVMLLGVL